MSNAPILKGLDDDVIVLNRTSILLDTESQHYRGPTTSQQHKHDSLGDIGYIPSGKHLCMGCSGSSDVKGKLLSYHFK
jgi:hypothetical protein